MTNDTKPTRLQRLRRALDWSRRKLEPFRRKRLEFLRQYVGYHYSDSAATEKVPVNLMEFAVNIYVRFLAANNPAAIVTTFHEHLKPEAETLRLLLNRTCEYIQLGQTLRRAIYEAMFGLSVVKVGLQPHARITVGGYDQPYGSPFADTVDIDDWAHDMSARRWDELAWAGNRYRIRYEHVMDGRLFSAKFRNSLVPQAPRPVNTEGDAGPHTISQGEDGHDLDEEEVVLWDIWCPYEQQIITLQDGESSELAEIREWTGPSNGPYHRLAFNEVPGNVMPLAPASLWIDLHDLANRLFRKAGRQAERQKTIGLYAGGAEEDVERINNTPDGHWCLSNAVGQSQVARFGGAEQMNLLMFLQCKDLYNSMAGNLELLGGISPQADTLGQDQILQANASKRVADMQARTIEFTAGIVRDLAFYLTTDPLIDEPVVKRFDENLEQVVHYSAEKRTGRFHDFRFDIEPYSMQYRSPGQRIQMLLNLWERVIIPAAPLLQAQGMAPNIEALLKVFSDYMQLPEVREIVSFNNPVPPETSGIEGPPKPPVTERRYVRSGRPGPTQAGKDDIMSRLLAGGGIQDSESAALLRGAV
ncbi:MAG: hypothetical protein AB1508_19035 [Pseudomonadota bacterium]